SLGLWRLNLSCVPQSPFSLAGRRRSYLPRTETSWPPVAPAQRLLGARSRLDSDAGTAAEIPGMRFGPAPDCSDRLCKSLQSRTTLQSDTCCPDIRGAETRTVQWLSVRRDRR